MSYNNFKAKIWSKEIQRELVRAAVFAADAVTKYSGEIKQKGDTVRIQGIAKPTISVYGNRQTISSLTPEKVEDTSISVVADHVATFCYGVPDIDKAQGADGVLSVLNTEASEETANKIDQLLAGISSDRSCQNYKNSGAAWTVTKSNIHEVLDGAQQMLWENDVPQGTLITVTMPPAMYMRLRQANIAIDQNNSELLKNGAVGKYGNMLIRISNNVYQDGSNNYYVQVKTQRAVALVKSEPHTEPFRPEGGFEDAVKGFTIYGAKLVRPKEFVNIVCTMG